MTKLTLKVLEARLNELEERVDALENPLALTDSVEETPSIVETPKVTGTVEEILGGPSEPIPFSSRVIVNEVLNQNFGVHLRSELGKFFFTVLVPEQYSNLSAEQREISGVDARTRGISTALGEEGVREWCKLIYTNFNVVTQSDINRDRVVETQNVPSMV